jgi:hypothetical protein
MTLKLDIIPIMIHKCVPKHREGVKLRPVLSLNYSGTILWYYFMAGAEIVPLNSLSDRMKKILMVLCFWCLSHV